MYINESLIISDGYCDEQLALACLLASGVCFINNLEVYFQPKTYTACIYVNCSDTFAYACADAESVMSSDNDEESEIIKLYKYCAENWKWGATKYCALKRNRKPIKQIIEEMKSDGYWCEELENLPN